jgi:UDP-glucose 4-epimerase
MKTVLLTGGTGFVGRNVIPILARTCTVLVPGRDDLALMDPQAVSAYLEENHVDVVIHSANPNPCKNPQRDSNQTMFEDSLRMFLNLYVNRALVEKMVYLGSGAEFDKSCDICTLSEDEGAARVPLDGYGVAKYLMNELACASKNVYNIRLFACYGPYDHESKFITHCIRCVLAGNPITIRQDCIFDYLHVFDLADILAYTVDHSLAFHDYNVGSGRRIALSDIARIVCLHMGVEDRIVIENDGWNREYTPGIERLSSETGLVQGFISLERGIAMQVEHEREQHRA